MIVKKIIDEFRKGQVELKKQNDQLLLQTEELQWANIFHDTIKNKPWLNNIAISPGRWAVNYSFLYVLVKVLSDYKPIRIIEFGLGESSKIVSSFLNFELMESSHLIIEQNAQWMIEFEDKFILSPSSKIIHLPLTKEIIKNCPVNVYQGFKEKVTGIYDLYLIDGPLGSTNFSRYDICHIADRLTKNDEFIIIMDDYNRSGEKDTAQDLLENLASKGIKTYINTYVGIKSQLVIATEKYRFAISM
ncbi:MAG: hypothetical protein JWR61_5301 [Ferruginibacter sp.]|uniref:hypothetical protein n=1 Tax=Ferruginibacter sp. TaxID=1940288 RepID=UPI00265A27D8|nr:hypothetical protein [Ferruginibacter sp.]MDB5280346.1 hypothetical protein [Ferruginibacter sp.]